MELNAKENADGIKWLVCAGGLAVVLAICLWRADDYMVGAAARDRAHNEQMKELRTAQSSLPALANDDRQLLPLSIESEK